MLKLTALCVLSTFALVQANFLMEDLPRLLQTGNANLTSCSFSSAKENSGDSSYLTCCAMLNVTTNGAVVTSLDVIVPTELDSTSFSASVSGNTSSISIACNYPPTVQSYYLTATGAVSNPNSTISSAAQTACKLFN
jgi:hypothetical protein